MAGRVLLDNTPSNLRLLGACRTGEPLSYILSTAMLVQSVNLAFEFINNNARSVLTDLNVF